MLTVMWYFCGLAGHLFDGYNTEFAGLAVAC